MSEPRTGGGPAGRQMDTWTDPGTDPETLASVTALYRDHSRWAIFPPRTAFSGWTAVRPASFRAPDPELPLLWAAAPTSTELSDEMRRADEALRPGWGPSNP